MAEVLDALSDFLDVLGAGLDIFTAVIEVLLCILLLVGLQKLFELILIQVFGNLGLRLPLLVGHRDTYLVDIDLFGGWLSVHVLFNLVSEEIFKSVHG